MALVEIDVTVARVGDPPSRLWHAVDAADVTVQNADGTPRTVYTDETGATVATQPLKSDNGRVDGWVEGGINLRYRAVKKGELAEPEPWQYFVSGGGPIGPQGPTGPSGLVWRGAWASGTAYAVNDAVTHDGQSFRRLVAGTTATVPANDTTNWELLAAKGTIGASEAWHVVGAAGEPAFENGWAAGVVAPAFYKDSAGIVRLRGNANGTTINTTVWTLPVGYRPAESILPFAVDAGNAYAVCQITDTGIVRARAGGLSQFGFNGVAFRAA